MKNQSFTLKFCSNKALVTLLTVGLTVLGMNRMAQAEEVDVSNQSNTNTYIVQPIAPVAPVIQKITTGFEEGESVVNATYQDITIILPSVIDDTYKPTVGENVYSVSNNVYSFNEIIVSNKRVFENLNLDQNKKNISAISDKMKRFDDNYSVSRRKYFG